MMPHRGRIGGENGFVYGLEALTEEPKHFLEQQR